VKAAVLPVTELHEHPSNVREDMGDIAELARSIQAVGLLEPLKVKPRPGGGYTIQDGHRRLAAIRNTTLDRAVCLIREAGDLRDDLVIMVATAMHKQLNPMELANAFDALRNQQMGVPAIARATGYSEYTVRTRLILLELPDEAQQMVAEQRLPLVDAEQLARDLRKTPSASTRPRSPRKAAWLAKTHPLASAVKAACQHAGTRTVIGGVGCGQCWEHAIRTDALTTATLKAAA